MLTPTPRILIVDRHPLLREALAARVELCNDLDLIGEASGISDAMALVRNHKPSLVTVGLNLRDGHGLELLKTIKTHNEGIKQLVVTMYDEAVFGERAYRAGASGYVNKSEDGEVVLKAARLVLQGKLYFGQATLKGIGSRNGQRSSSPNESPLARLSDREMEIFQLIGSGHSTRAIAARLELSVHTIDAHREKIKRKLGLRNGAELARNAIQFFLEHRI